ncbi:MAG: hypothetical protein Q7J25_12260 [Vicinamibacterales bacterium]|nr:hypothetical protein [Vicinamibacterales bacterium]
MAEPEVIEVEPQSTSIAIRERQRSAVLLMPVMDVNTAMVRLKEFQEFCGKYLEESKDGGNDGGDYGVIPGTKKKALLKSGAEKLCEIYGLYDQYKFISKIEDWELGLFDYSIECTLMSRRDDSVVGTGLGSCSSFESKYRWRDSGRLCPNCKQPAIIKGKEEYGGGWLCFGKKGGCGSKFADTDPLIVGQTIGRVENPDIIDIKNTVLKMAKKRCLGSNTAVLVRTPNGISRVRADGMFTMHRDNTPMELPGPDGSWLRVRAMVREERQGAVNIRLADGAGIYASAEHVFPVVGVGELSVADLSVGHLLQRGRLDLGNHALVDPEVGWVAGLFIAEGNFDRTVTKFTLCGDEEQFVERIVRVAEKLGAVVRANRRRAANVLDVNISGRAFYGLMAQFVVGDGSDGKHLSKYAWRQGNAFARAVLDGYIAGDGHRQTKGTQEKYVLGFTRRNHALASDLRTLSAIIGARLSLRPGESTCAGRIYPTTEGWISFSEPAYNGKDLGEIVDIAATRRPSVVYDIEVDDPHLFVLGNGVVSHNSKIDAVIGVTRSSGIFTQDLDDLVAVGEVHETKPAQTQETKPAQTQAEKVAAVKAAQAANAAKAAPAPTSAAEPAAPAAPATSPAPAASTPAAPAPVAAAGTAGVVLVSGLNVKSGVTNNKKWTLYIVTFNGKVKASDGNLVDNASTLEESVALQAENCRDAKTPVIPVIVPGNKKGSYNLTQLDLPKDR